MKKFRLIAAALACMALTATAFGMPVKAEEPVRTNLAPDATVTQYTPGFVESDTLAAINDGLQYPSRPHSAAGANPYAWTNYDSAQQYGIERDTSLWFRLKRISTIDEIVVYYFVDSWSASLPKNVSFDAYTEGGDNIPWMMSYTEPERISDTCIRQVYRLSEPVRCKTFVLNLEADDSSLLKGNTRCVGIYEIELYGVADLKETVISWPIGVYGMEAGSTEPIEKNMEYNAVDGNPDTIWHSSWQGCKDDERWIMGHIGKSSPVYGLRYLPRSGSKPWDSNGRVGDFEVWCGTGSGWVKAAEGHWEDSEGWKEVLFDQPVENVYWVKLVGVTTYGDSTPNKYMSAAEIEYISNIY